MSFFRAAVFLFVMSMKNRVLRLVRHPKYLLFALIGIFMVGSRLIVPALAPTPGRDVLVPAQTAVPVTNLIMLLIAGGVYVYVLSVWLFGAHEVTLQYTEPEVHFFFSAPVSRKRLIQYKLAQMIFGSLLGSLVFTIIGGRGRHPFYFALGMFFAIATLVLHRTAASLVRASLAAHGVSALRRRAVTLVVAVVVASVFAAIFVRTVATIPPLRVDSLSEWLDELRRWSDAHDTTLYWVLLPVVAPERVMLATSLGDFLRALPAAVALVVGHYAWAMSSTVAFEEAAAAAAERRAKRLAQFRTARHVPRKGTRLFTLASGGAPWVAIVWKNLIVAGVTRRAPALVIGLVLGASVLVAPFAKSWGIVAGAALAMCAVLVSIIGPVTSKADVRADLDNVDLLRSYPLGARQIVFASVLAPFALLTSLVWTSLAASTIFFAASLRGRDVGTTVASMIGAALVLPALVAFGLLVQNLLAITFPALSGVRDTGARGLEASGQRVVALFVMLFVLAVTLVPAGIVAVFASALLAHVLGAATPIVACALASIVTFGEAWVALALATKAFEKLDPTERAI
jgi:hypothetical protein